MMRRPLLLFALALAAAVALAGEGMYPISELRSLDFKAFGLHVTPDAVYRPGGGGLIDAIVNIGGCTGSFVSNDGLILTNHHCAFPAVQAASSPDHDYVTEGFLARTRAEELPARGNSVRITETYRDVSAEVLGAVADSMDPGERARAIQAKMKTIVAATERENKGKRAEVAEMFAGKTYVLFVYAYLRDVRLVYVPPRSIGEFGGENDNWVWPRHTGDFSFLRAYVAPDGSPAEYAPGNVPYHPRTILQINPRGVDEGDAVFILGYPGRTYRHRTSHYLHYEQYVRMPFIASLYEWQIETMRQAGKADRAIALRLDARMKNLANTSKNYRGKLLGLARLALVDRKRGEEEALQAFIDATPERKARFGTVLGRIGEVYRSMEEEGTAELVLDALRNASAPLGAAMTITTATRERRKPDLEREAAYMDRAFEQTRSTLLGTLRNFHEPVDRALFAELLRIAGALPAGHRLSVLDSLLADDYSSAGIARFLAPLYAGTRCTDPSFVAAALGESGGDPASSDDTFMRLAHRLAPAYRELREMRQRREGTLAPLSALLVDVKAEYLKTAFIPDGNSTLRFTCGRIRGYAPADATTFAPITTVNGVVEKTTGVEPYNTPAALLNLVRRNEFGRFRHPRLGTVPVALLYDLDTTGGNSGSPLLNADGELVGVNFDRAFEATINDFAWSADYSRSIAVDVRYVLWVTESIGGAGWLLDEMGV
jgi:hypothetical protein